MQFTLIWIVSLILLIGSSLAILLIAKLATNPIDSYSFSFKRVFPFEALKESNKAEIVYKVLLCVLVAACFTPIFSLLTSYEKVKNVELITILASCAFGFGGLCFAFLHHFDATHTRAHLSLFILFICFTLLGNVLSAIRGLAVYQAYLNHGYTLPILIVGAVISGLCGIGSMLIAVNPKLKNWAVLQKTDSGYVRPKIFILAFSEWLTFLALIIGELGFFLILSVN